MSPKPIHTRALVLRRLDYSESSQIVTVDTRDLGIVDLLARGSRREARRGSSFAEPLDLGGWYDIVYRARSGDLGLATEARLIEGFPRLRDDLSAWLEACFALEVLRASFTAGDPHPELLRGTLSFLKLLAVGKGRLALRVRFLHELLYASGVAPGWEHCAGCRRPLTDRAYWQLPAALHCEGCRGGSDRPVPSAVRETVAQIAGMPWGNLPSEGGSVRPLGAAWELMRDALLSHLEHAPRSLRYLRA